MINDVPYKRSFIDILGDVVEAMPLPEITIFSVVVLAPFKWKLYVNDFFYAAYKQQITIQAKRYTIVSLDDTPGNFTMTIIDPTNALAAPIAGTFNLYPFYFFHGTPIDTANELGAVKKVTDKYPMIWLWDDFTEVNSWDPSTANDRETTCKIFFLDQMDPKVIPTDSRWDSYLKPMMKFRDYFMNYVADQLQDFMIWGMTTTDRYHSKFGVYISGKGVQESMIADNLAGVEMAGTFTVRSPGADLRSCTLS